MFTALRAPHLEVIVTDPQGLAGSADRLAFVVADRPVGTRDLEGPVAAGVSVTLMADDTGERTVVIEAIGGDAALARFQGFAELHHPVPDIVLVGAFKAETGYNKGAAPIG